MSFIDIAKFIAWGAALLLTCIVCFIVVCGSITYTGISTLRLLGLLP